MARVCISTPTKGNVRAETSEWRLRAFVQLCPDVEIHTVITSLPLQHARNEQVRRFLETKCTHLFLLDADCLPQEGTIQQLLAYDLPIISAPHSTIVKGERGLMVVDPSPDRKSYVQHYPLERLQGPRVRVGCGGLLIRRDVFEKLSPPWFVCQYDEKGLLTLSEDFYFCERALASGYEIWAQCDLWQKHFCGEWI